MEKSSTTLRNLKFSEFKELIEFLGEHSESSEEILGRAEMFFPRMRAAEEIGFMNVIEGIVKEDTDAEKTFLQWQEQYPDIEIDKEGKTKPEPKQYWEIPLQSLDVIYDSAKNTLAENNYNDTSKFKVNSQVYNAKNLNCLLNMGRQDTPYVANRAVFLKNNSSDYLDAKILNKAEKSLKEIGLNFAVLNRMINYIRKKKITDYHIFVEHLIARINILAQDKKMENPSNKKFYEILKQIED